MSTESSLCSASEQSQIDVDLKSYLTLVRAAVGATNFAAAVNLIPQDITLTSLTVTTVTMNCHRCFRAFMLDVWRLFRDSKPARIGCRDIQSSTCESDVLGPALGRFQDCSGFQLGHGSSSQCGTQAEGQNVLLAAAVVATALEKENSNEFLIVIPDVYQNLNATSRVNDTCFECYRYLGASLADMSEDEKSICAGLDNPACFELIATPLANFRSCTGYSFPVSKDFWFVPDIPSNTPDPTNVTDSKGVIPKYLSYATIFLFMVPIIF